jgi:hypothetical protein
VEFATGLRVDPLAASMQGSLAVQILNCLNDPAPDVRLRFSDPDQPELQSVKYWAAQGYIPVSNQPTDVTGVAGFINLPSGNYNVEVVATISGQERVFGRRGFHIEPGRLTTGTMRPYYLDGL